MSSLLSHLALPPGWSDATALWGAAAASLIGGLMMLAISPAGRTAGSWLIGVIVTLAITLGLAGRVGPGVAPWLAALVVAGLARDPQLTLESECGLKLAWVMGGALALSWAGLSLLALVTGTTVVSEQWAILSLGLDPRLVWGTTLSLSLLAALVLLGGAPFHFWLADLFHGADLAMAPLAVTALQIGGVAWLTHRLEGISAFAPAAALVSALLGAAAVVAFLAGGATLLAQRRPERRVGTLASLNGALALASVGVAYAAPRATGVAGAGLEAWAAHAALALTGAGALARFTPIGPAGTLPAAVLYRRHPLSALLGIYALLSLSGAPGTPGGLVWLDTARSLARAGETGVLLALGAAWLAAFGATVRQVRDAFGVPTDAPPPERPVPVEARVTLWIAGLGLLALGASWWLAR